MQAFCGRRLWSLTCTATRLHSCPALTPLSIFYLPNSKGFFFFFPTYTGRKKQNQTKTGWRGGEKNRWCLLRPCPLSGAYRGCLLPSSKLQRFLPRPAACSVHSSLGKGQCSCKLATRWPLLQGFVHILGSAESGACLSHLLCCSAGPFCSERSIPCKCCSTCARHSLRHLSCSTSFYIFAFLYVQYSF